jgi:hypothetical protein
MDPAEGKIMALPTPLMTEGRYSAVKSGKNIRELICWMLYA